jgi:hypothetical protein
VIGTTLSKGSKGRAGGFVTRSWACRPTPRVSMGVTAMASRPCISINLVYCVLELEREHRVAQAAANSFQSLLEAETQRTQLL